MLSRWDVLHVETNPHGMARLQPPLGARRLEVLSTLEITQCKSHWWSALQSYNAIQPSLGGKTVL